MTPDEMLQNELAFVAAMKRLVSKQPTQQLRFSSGGLVQLVALVQLALRHPGTRGVIAAKGREFVTNTIRLLERQEPAIGPLLRQGDDPRLDVR